MTLQDHHVERDRDRRLHSMHHHAKRVTDQNDIAILVDEAGGMRMI
jgi:hypothetical protein